MENPLLTSEGEYSLLGKERKVIEGRGDELTDSLGYEVGIVNRRGPGCTISPHAIYYSEFCPGWLVKMRKTWELEERKLVVWSVNSSCVHERWQPKQGESEDSAEPPQGIHSWHRA